MKKTIPGFALLEVAIALSVLGVITYMCMPLLGKMQQWQQIKITNQHQEKIVEALAGYVLMNKRLPCPALTSNGEAQATCTSTKVGFVPYRTLGIDEKIAKDGNHHWITYAVQPNLTSPGIMLIRSDPDFAIDPKTVFCKTTGDAAFAVQNEAGQSVIMPPDFVALALISHGKSGGYANDNAQIQTVNSTDPDKIKNAARSGIFTTKPYRQTSEAIFDDTVFFVSRNNLMAQWAKYLCQR